MSRLRKSLFFFFFPFFFPHSSLPLKISDGEEGKREKKKIKDSLSINKNLSKNISSHHIASLNVTVSGVFLILLHSHELYMNNYDTSELLYSIPPLAQLTRSDKKNPPAETTHNKGFPSIIQIRLRSICKSEKRATFSPDHRIAREVRGWIRIWEDVAWTRVLARHHKHFVHSLYCTALKYYIKDKEISSVSP